MKRDLLFEIGLEEVPARFMPGALRQLEDKGAELLAAHRVEYDALRVLGTPRRLVLIAKGVVIQQSDYEIVEKGPSTKAAFDGAGKPTKAAEGFARSRGVAVEALEIQDGYIYSRRTEKGRNVAELLPAVLRELMDKLQFPKNMRWADLELRFVRPVKWLLALFGGDVLPFEFAGVQAGCITRGHRFLGQQSIAVTGIDDYLAKLEENFVIAAPEKREELIVTQVKALAAAVQGTAVIDPELLAEVVQLVEYPTALRGTFEEEYLQLPAAAVMTPMKEHQRYFPIIAADGKLLPYFITVRNGGNVNLSEIQHGNERVLRARLADANFFFKEDQKVKLVDRVERLKSIVFQEGLGTLFDKVQRIEALALYLLDLSPTAGDDQQKVLVSRAAQLAKADLTTGMVYEFTELQGVMGREYARLNGEAEEVAQAIFEHYQPRNAEDELPASIVGRMVSIADKIDNIVATFSRGLIPTGSQDPYALRRQALGIVNILAAENWHLSLTQLVQCAAGLLSLPAEQTTVLQQQLQEFFTLRIRNVLADRGVRYDIVDAVLGAPAADCDVVGLIQRAEGLQQELDGSLNQATAAMVRVSNLAQKAGDHSVAAELFVNEQEQALWEVAKAVDVVVAAAVADGDFRGAVTAIATVFEPVQRFFDAVMVMDQDERIRNNRLALLRDLRNIGLRIADFNKIVA